MENAWNAVRAAVQEGDNLEAALWYYADNLAPLLIGRLRNVGDKRTLARLKSELSAFDSRSGKWKRHR